MKQIRTGDESIRHPNQDFLGMATQAENLSKFLEKVELPFTLGIYGEWGEGKTSFVELLEYYLIKRNDWSECSFINFSAWPYTTSDAIWRALLIEIASKIYDVDKKAEPESLTSGQGIIPILRNFLRQDAIILQKPKQKTSNQEKYSKLVNMLDNSAPIGNRSQGIEVDNNSAMFALSNMFLGAGSNFVPWLSGIRKLLGLDGAVNLGKLASQVGSGQREVVKSVEDIRRELREMFNFAPKKRLVILIDDLDRCMPEVALDVLELIKIFFFESKDVNAQCLFIVAADQKLIGEGLNARFRKSLKGEEFLESYSLLDQKGREYFEKIIQFGVRLPEKDFNHIHHFIGGYFPAWTCTTDILYTAIGTNPRRLKQQCNLLSFKQIVTQEKNDTESETNTDNHSYYELFEKLTLIQSHSPERLEQIRQIARKPNSYLEEIKKYLKEIIKVVNPQFNNVPIIWLLLREIDCIAGILFLRKSLEVGHNQDKNFLKEAFLNPPLLSEAKVEPEIVEMITEFADVRPGSNGIIESSDPVFQYITRLVLDRDGKVSLTQLLTDNFATIFGIHQKHPIILKFLVELAKSPLYKKDIQAIDNYLDQLLDHDAEAQISVMETEAGNGIFNELEKILEKENLSKEEGWLFLKSPRLSHLTPGQISAYEKIQNQIYKKTKLVNKSVIDEITKWRHATSQVLEPLRNTKHSAIETELKLLEIRKDIAIELLGRRKFAKIQALDQAWPSLSKQILIDGSSGLSALRNLEKVVLERIRENDDNLTEWYRKYLKDKKLIRFLRLPPLFHEIYYKELADSLEASQIVSEPTLLSNITESVEVTPTVTLPLKSYQNVTVKFKMLSTEPSTEELFKRFEVDITNDFDDDSNLNKVEQLEIPIDEFNKLPAQLNVQETYLYSRSANYATRKLIPIGLEEPSDPEENLKIIGTKLFDFLFRKIDVSSLFQNSKQRIRLILEMVDAEISELPWESLYLPDFQEFLARSLKFSLVRHIPESVEFVPRSLEPPLRVLGLFANDKSVPLNLEQEKEILEQTLEQAIKDRYVELRTIDNVSINLLTSELRRFQPHIVHFAGHGTLKNGEGHLIFVDDEEQRNRVELSSEGLGLMLQDYNINLVILNGCYTGSTGTKIMHGVAHSLIRKGVPAVIATMREILDDAALIFTRELYRALADGYPIESAVVEARKTLRLKKRDWSAYALFSSNPKLENLRLIRNRGDENRRE